MAAQTDAQKRAARAQTQEQRDPGTVQTAPELPEGEATEAFTARMEAREAARATTDTAEAGPTGSPAPRVTTLDTDVSMPSYVAPGDGPHDTVVSAEHATSVLADKGSAGQQGFGVVNAVVPIPDPSGRTQALARSAEAAGESAERTEEYVTPSPSGKMVRVRHNIDTGATEVLGEA